MAVLPDWRGKGIAEKLYLARKKLLTRFNLRRMVAGGRIPGYSEYAGRFTPEEYINKVQEGALSDMALSAHLKAGYLVKGVHMDYLFDEESLNYATFLEMPNPKYNAERQKISGSPIKSPVRKAYMRVRHTAQARAVENMIFVVMSGSIGNLPQVKSFLINYGQAAILTPSDFGFPLNGVVAEAEPNSETEVIADLNLADLAQQRELGSVTPLKDRRMDLYEVKAKTKIEVIRTN